MVSSYHLKNSRREDKKLSSKYREKEINNKINKNAKISTRIEKGNCGFSAVGRQFFDSPRLISLVHSSIPACQTQV
jgi:hypothetical protein